MKLSALAIATLLTLSACSNQTQPPEDQAQNEATTAQDSELIKTAFPQSSGPNIERAGDSQKQQITDSISKESKLSIAPIKARAEARSVKLMAPQAMHSMALPIASREKYQQLDEQGVQRVDEHPVSTFSIDVDSASYANVRRMISQGSLPPKGAIRVEELVNYFSYQYPMPESAAHPIKLNTLITDSPWNENNQLIRIGLQSYQESTSQRANANLVFLVDVSGSMRSPNKLGLAQKSLNLMLSKLKTEDKISLVTYAGATQVVLPPTSVKEAQKIKQAISSLTAGGSTYGEAGIHLAYSQAQQGFIKDGINQIFLISDGDLNVGLTDTKQLKELIEQKRAAGVQFSTLGFGQGNYNDHLMEQLADVGNGNASYIDTLHEAQKVLVDQLGSQLQTVAHDVKIQVEFNPAQVSEYRLIGYENRQLKREDFNNDKKDAGEIGAGHTVTAIYEITPKGKQGLTDPLVFQEQNQPQRSGSKALAEIRVRYKLAHGTASHKEVFRIEPEQQLTFSQLSPDDKFSIAVAAWGQKLRGSSYVNNLSYAQIIEWANHGRGLDPFGYRAEFIKLARLSESLAQ